MLRKREEIARVRHSIRTEKNTRKLPLLLPSMMMLLLVLVVVIAVTAESNSR
jgi:hypothetical protein